MKLRVLLLAGWLAIGLMAPSHAFEVTGYTHGMTIEEVRTRVASGGSWLEEDRANPGTWLMSAEQGSAVTAVLQFCDGKLFALSYIAHRDFGGFTAEIA